MGNSCRSAASAAGGSAAIAAPASLYRFTVVESQASTSPGRAPITSASASPAVTGASIQRGQPETSCSPHSAASAGEPVARGDRQAPERVAVEVDAVVGEDEAVAERAERVRRVGGLGVGARQPSHAVTARQSGLAGSRCP